MNVEPKWPQWVDDGLAKKTAEAARANAENDAKPKGKRSMIRRFVFTPDRLLVEEIERLRERVAALENQQ